MKKKTKKNGDHRIDDTQEQLVASEKGCDLNGLDTQCPGVASSKNGGNRVSDDTQTQHVPATNKSHADQGHSDTHYPDVGVAATKGEGCQWPHDTHPLFASSPIQQLQELQSNREQSMRMEFRINNAARADIRRYLNWNWDLPEKERAKINKDAADIMTAIENGQPHPIAPKILIHIQAKSNYINYREFLEKEMKRLAESLPAWSQMEQVKGFGLMGMACIIGEAGDLSNYANPAKLWKRLGLAPRSEYASITNDGEPCTKMPKRRRSVSWRVADSLLRQKNKYQELYYMRREHELVNHPECDKGTDKKTGKQKIDKAADRRARRYAEKRLIRDLWNVWQGKEVNLLTNDHAIEGSMV